MPNWCECKLTISGKKKERDNFLRVLEKAKEITNDDDKRDRVGFKMNWFVPRPLFLEKTSSPGDNPNWYDWDCENWGVKWEIDVSEDDIKEISKSIIINYATAWAPNSEFVKKLSKMFKHLKFTLQFWESGMGFQGKEIFENGTLTFEEEKQYGGSKGG